MPAVPRFTTTQRRARLVARHHLARTAADPDEAVRSVVAGHSSDPITPFLAAWARVQAFEVDDLEHALYGKRTLWRLHAMRRTLFVVPTDEAAVFHAGAGAEVARKERRRVVSWLAADMDAEHVPAWLSNVEERTLEVLGDGQQWRTQDLTAAVPELATKLTLGSGRWTAQAPLSSRLLFLLALDGHIARARPAGTWRSSQYHWVAARSWFPSVPARLDEADGRAELLRRYVAACGPATMVDLRWWTGWTVARTKAALETVGAVPVELEDGEGGGQEGFVLPDDLDGDAEEAPRGPQVAFLPTLDSTPMGWKQRGWYLRDEHTPWLFDRNGNAGPTVWLDGRIVGGWAQSAADGTVRYRLLEDVDPEACERIEAEAAELTRWLDGVVAVPRFRSTLDLELSG